MNVSTLAFRALGVTAVLAAALATPLGAGAQQVAGRPIDGIACQAMEGAKFHIHQHVSIYDHGTPVALPADLGQVPGQCLYWIHTHTADGIVHIESPEYRTFTLGNLFDVWGRALSRTDVGGTHLRRGQLHVFVNGKPYVADPRKIDLAEHTDITLEAGPPYTKPAPFSDWGGN